MIVPDAPGTLPFVPLREGLYTQDELTRRTTIANDGGLQGATPDPAGPTVDEVVGAWFHGVGHGVDFAVVRALHDATIDVALARHLVGRVGRGGHGWACRSARQR